MLGTYLEIQAIDISVHSKLRSLWCRGAISMPDDTDLHHLEPHGFASPMGFWLFESSTTTSDNKNFKIYLSETKSEIDNIKQIFENQLPQTITLNLPRDLAKDRELAIAIDAHRAYVCISQAHWKIVSDALLLAITQYWRFNIIEQQLDNLSSLTRYDLSSAGMPSLRSWRYSKRFTKNDLLVRSLAQNMPNFQGPLLAPYRYLTSDLKVDIYMDVTEDLDITGWADQLDFQLETISDAYETITEKFFHYKSFMLEITFEVLIIVILIFNVMLYIYSDLI